VKKLVPIDTNRLDVLRRRLAELQGAGNPPAPFTVQQRHGQWEPLLNYNFIMGFDTKEEAEAAVAKLNEAVRIVAAPLRARALDEISQIVAEQNRG
jgi:hypothetical protein